MHKAMLKAMRSTKNIQLETTNNETLPPKKMIFAEVVGKSQSTLQCPIQAAKTYAVTGNLRNLKTGKEAQGIDFVIDTGSQFAVVIPSFLSDQLGLDDSSLIRVFGMNTVDGGSLDAPTYKTLLTINNIPIQTTVTVSGTAGEKALIGAELLSLFDLEIHGDSCRLSLIASK